MISGFVLSQLSLRAGECGGNHYRGNHHDDQAQSSQRRQNHGGH